MQFPSRERSPLGLISKNEGRGKDRCTVFSLYFPSANGSSLFPCLEGGNRGGGRGPFAFASSRIQRYVLGTAARSRDRIDKECATRRTVDRSENLGKTFAILSLDFIHKVGSSKSSVCYATGKLSLHGGIRIMEMRSMVSSVDRAARMEIGSRVEFEIFISILRKVSRASGIFPLGWKTWEDDVWMEMQIVCGCRQWSTVGWD